MFSRTQSGLSSEYLFHKVDLVIYCEGKILEGEASSLDEVFWERVFLENGKSVKCKSIGSKTTVKLLANKIISENINNVAIAMDRDYDDLRNMDIKNDKVLYTFGYSWENDVIHSINFDLVFPMFASSNRRSEIRVEFEAYKKLQSRQLKRVFALDYKYISHSSSLFNREKPLSIVGFGGTNAPHVKRHVLLKKAAELGKFQTGNLPREIYQSACGIQKFFGKTVSRLFYQWFVYRAKNFPNKTNIPYEAFMSMLTANLQISSQHSERDRYYRSIVNAI